MNDKENDIIITAAELSKNNRDRISKTATHGCYHCIGTIIGVDIVDWTDNGQTALCPKCGIDSILPYVTDTKVLADIHEYWLEEPAVLTILEKLKVLETVKNIYNIHYCKAGVGIVFYYPERHKIVDDYKNGLNCKQYYPTFEDCIAAEYNECVSEGMVEELKKPADVVNTVRLPAPGNYFGSDLTLSQPRYEYRYVSEYAPELLAVKVNGFAAMGWEAFGGVAIMDSVRGGLVYCMQAMRKEIIE